MLLVKPRSLRAKAYDITDGMGAVVASLQLTPRQDGVTLEHGDDVYQVKREIPGAWQMWKGEELVFEARRPPMIENRFMTVVTGAELEIAPVGGFLRKFKVVGPDWVDLGTIERTSLVGHGMTVDLSDLIPQPAQLFLIIQAIVISRRFDP